MLTQNNKFQSEINKLKKKEKKESLGPHVKTEEGSAISKLVESRPADCEDKWVLFNDLFALWGSWSH